MGLLVVVLFLGGVALSAYALGEIYPPLTPLVAGASLLGLSFAAHRSLGQRP